MRTFVMLLAVIAGMLFGNVAFAGGIIPNGYGSHGNSKDVIPATPGLVRWYYNGLGVYTYPWVHDAVVYAVASIDRETLAFNFMQARSQELEIGTWTNVTRIRVLDTPATEGCTDSTPGDCVWAATYCTDSTLVAHSYLCTRWRIDVFVENIIYTASRNGVDLLPWVHSLLRHEVAHTLGMSHGMNQGPMHEGSDPFTACQLAMMDTFVVLSTLPTWIYVNVPECN